MSAPSAGARSLPSSLWTCSGNATRGTRGMKVGKSPGSEPGTTSCSYCSLPIRPPEDAESSNSPVTTLRQVGHRTWSRPRASKPRPALSEFPLAPSAQWVTYVLPPALRVHPMPATPQRPEPRPLLPLLSLLLARRASREGPVRFGRRGRRGREEGREESAQNRNRRGPLRQSCRSRGPAARCPPRPSVPPALHVVDLHAGAAHEVVTAVYRSTNRCSRALLSWTIYSSLLAVEATVLRKGA